MNAYYACSSCSRYVKEGEGSCPFCQAPRTVDARPVRSGGALTVSRAQWLAFGSTLVVAGAACSSAVVPTRSDTGAETADASLADGAQGCPPGPIDGATVDTGDASPADGAQAWDAGPIDDAAGDADGGDALGPRVPDASSCAHGAFACGDGGLTCERSNQFCVHNTDQGAYRCESYTATGALDGAACGDCPQCGCVRNQWTDPCEPGSDYTAPTSCSASAGGEIVVDEISCGPCYGAPPARLERLAA